MQPPLPGHHRRPGLRRAGGRAALGDGGAVGDPAGARFGGRSDLEAPSRSRARRRKGPNWGSHSSTRFCPGGSPSKRNAVLPGQRRGADQVAVADAARWAPPRPPPRQAPQTDGGVRGEGEAYPGGHRRRAPPGAAGTGLAHRRGSARAAPPPRLAAPRRRPPRKVADRPAVTRMAGNGTVSARHLVTPRWGARRAAAAPGLHVSGSAPERREGRTAMPKIALIGAGSATFSRRLLADLLVLAGAGGRRVRPDGRRHRAPGPDRGAGAAGWCRRRASGARVEATTEPGAGAGRGGLRGHHPGHRLRLRARPPGRGHPGAATACTRRWPTPSASAGVFRYLRTMPAMLEIGRDMERLCPEALWLNYVNPMNMIMWTLSAAVPGIRTVGLCHSVQGTAERLAGFVGVPHEEVAYWVAGINHQAWFLRAAPRHLPRGGPLPPPVAGHGATPEATTRTGCGSRCCATSGTSSPSSSRHMSEYVPWFRRTAEDRERYTPASTPDCRRPAPADGTGQQPATAERRQLAAVPRAGSRSWDEHQAADRRRGPDRLQAQPGVLLVHRARRGGQHPLPVQRQRAQHRPDHQPARRAATWRCRSWSTAPGCTPATSATCPASWRRSTAPTSTCRSWRSRASCAATGRRSTRPARSTRWRRRRPASRRHPFDGGRAVRGQRALAGRLGGAGPGGRRV